MSPAMRASFAETAQLKAQITEAQGANAPEPRMRLRVQIATAREFAGVGEQWADLCARAVVPNVFMDPAVALACVESWSYPLRVLLVWHGDTGKPPRLEGAWLLVEQVTRLSWPWTALVSPCCPVAYLGTPVIDRALTAPVFAMMLEAIRKSPELPKLVQVADLSVHPAISGALEAVLAGSAGSARVIETRTRAKLVSGPEPRSIWAGSMSRQRLQGFDRKRRQLARAGRLAFTSVDTPEAVAAALDDFLRLESSGWKGRRHSALASDVATSQFTIRMVAGLAQRRLVSVQSLSLDGAPVAMWIILYSGAAAYTWRTAFDESFSRFSPGILLLEDTTAHLLTRPGVAFTDSCNHRDVGHQAERWPERHDVCDLLIDVASGTGARLSILARREIASRAGRQIARDLYHRLRRGLDRAAGRLRAFRATLATRLSR